MKQTTEQTIHKLADALEKCSLREVQNGHFRSELVNTLFHVYLMGQDSEHVRMTGEHLPGYDRRGDHGPSESWIS